MGYPDEFVKHGTCQEIEKLYELDEESIVAKIMKVREELKEQKRGNTCLKILEKMT